MGSFIISDFVKGVPLSDILRDQADRKRLYLDPKIDRQILDTIFKHIVYDCLFWKFELAVSLVSILTLHPMLRERSW